MPLQTFELTQDHITLLSHAYVDWEDCETGAPAIDPKRPYGNSDVPGDIAEILEIEPDCSEEDGYAYLSHGLEEKLLKIHRETETALNIILGCQSFAPGRYEREGILSPWRKVHG